MTTLVDQTTTATTIHQVSRSVINHQVGADDTHYIYGNPTSTISSNMATTSAAAAAAAAAGGGGRQRRNSKAKTTHPPPPPPPQQQPTPTTDHNLDESSADGGSISILAPLPPLALVCILLLCSGCCLGVLSWRDFAMTGHPLFLNDAFPDWLRRADQSYLEHTSSTQWYDDTDGWKSTQGGFSAVQQVSTDANNMGGFFIRKMAGAIALGWSMYKLVPLLYTTPQTIWMSSTSSSSSKQQQHYTPWLGFAILGNMMIVLFWLVHVVEWQTQHLTDLIHYAVLHITVLGVETMVMMYYAATLLSLFQPSRHDPSPSSNTTTTTTSTSHSATTMKTNENAAIAHAFPKGKTPTSLPSNIVSRTVLLISGTICALMVRDLCFAAFILSTVIPRDDVYLEWTNALRHSPPKGSPEYAAYGMDAPLYSGDLFVSQYLALHMIVSCAIKLLAATTVRLGKDGRRGTLRTKLIWQGMSVSNGLLMFVIRLFTPAAASVALDFRYILMALGYETFILALYGFW